MAIFHLNVKTISRRRGSSAVCAAAYRAGEKLYDERRRRTYNFERRGDISYSAILIPGGGAVSTRLRGALWNAVEARERGPHACVALEAVFALPRELDGEACALLAQNFVEEAFVRRGMVTDLNVHAAQLTGRVEQPHAHALLSTRAMESMDGEALALGTPDGLRLGRKLAPWRRRDQLLLWRETLADAVNAALAENRIDRRVDHRTYRAQGVRLEPQNKIGPAGARRAIRGEPAERAADHQDISARNGDRIIEDPAIALTAITHRQSTFTEVDLKDFLRRQTDDPGQYELALAGARASTALVRLGRDAHGEERFTSRDLLAAETRLEALGVRLREDEADRPRPNRPPHVASAASEALTDLLSPKGLTILAGGARDQRDGVLRMAAASWRADGRRVLALTATSAMARGVHERIGISARSLSSLDRTSDIGLAFPGKPHIVMVDQAGLFASRSLERIAEAAAAGGLKLVLTADALDLEAGETAAGLRALASRADHVRVLGAALGRGPWLDVPAHADAPWDAGGGRTDGQAAALFAVRRGFAGIGERAQGRLDVGSNASDAIVIDGRRGRADRQPRGDDLSEHSLEALHARWAHRTVRVMAKAVLEAEAGETRHSLPRRTRLLARAAGRMEALWPGSAPALAEAVALRPELLSGAASGRTAPVLAAMRDASVRRGGATPAWMQDVDLGLGHGRGRD